ncbi:zf-HC2 domain-containing protein [Nocardia sp. NPDC052254]|uniref:anti-sigma factor family protein n=1 Tax=Nocardia sp. NPDC052254 TaxID=3155681 RepID=UPI0034394CB5
MTSADSDSPDEYATWDAPYVLGALDQEQRLAYENHLIDCVDCRAAVAELSGLPGLLSRVPGDVALSLTDEVEPAGSRTAAPVFGDAGFEALLDRVRAAEQNGSADAGGILPFEAGRTAPPPEPPRPAGPTATDTGSAAAPEGSAEPDAGAQRPDDTVASLDAARERKRRRNTGWGIFAGAVAAAAAAVAITIPATITITQQQEHPPTTQQQVLQRQMDQVVPSPITANFSLTPVESGTRVNMSCNYAPSDTDYNWDGALWVVHTDGTQSMLAQWTAHPGQDITADGITSVPPDKISSVEIRSSTTNQVFLRGTV